MTQTELPPLINEAASLTGEKGGESHQAHEWKNKNKRSYLPTVMMCLVTLGLMVFYTSTLSSTSSVTVVTTVNTAAFLRGNNIKDSDNDKENKPAVELRDDDKEVEREDKPTKQKKTDVSIITAAIAAVVAVVGAIISVCGDNINTKLDKQIDDDRKKKNDEAKAKALYAEYSDPLLYAAYSLQSRLFNIVAQNFLALISLSDREKHYVIYSTLYVVGEFLGWVEIIRKEIQFLDLPTTDKSTLTIMKEITELFAKCPDSIKSEHFMLWQSDQRAIGESMLFVRDRALDVGRLYDVIGYAKFCQMMEDEKSVEVNFKFKYWFKKLEESILFLSTIAKQLEEETGYIYISNTDKDSTSPFRRTDVKNLLQALKQKDYQRLIQLQNKLFDLIKSLDPNGERITENFKRLPSQSS